VWKTSIRKAHGKGVPIVAECGGMMAIVNTLNDQHGHAWPMAGLLPGRVTMQKRLGGLGLQALSTPQGQLRGHTFHFSWLETDITPSANTSTHPVGEIGEAIYRVGSLTASYFHAYFPSCPEAVAALFSR
jgi:cobyrinic acid a,c-diamide synthase